MLNTLTEATFAYKGARVTARPVTDTLSCKFFSWSGRAFGIEGPQGEGYPVAAKTIVKFEEQFILLVDSLTQEEAKPLEAPTVKDEDDDELSDEMRW